MTANRVVGSLAALWRFPVKSMQGTRLAEAELTERGILGDRAYALIDANTGKVVSAKSVKLFPDLLSCRAAFVESPRADQEPPPVRITLPDDTSVTSDSNGVDGVLSTYFLTTSTLERLDELRPQSRFDQRRFRMNLIVDTPEAGFVENDWVGSELAIGEVTRLSVAKPDARCVMTTLAQGELAKDTDVLRTLVEHNSIQAGDAGRFPCAGVYAVVEAPGTIRVGDPVALP